MALPVRVDRPDVAPVAVEAGLARAAVVDQPRQHLVTEVLELVVARLVGELLERLQQRVRAEHEDLVGNQVALRLVGLVGVVDDLAALDLHDPVAIGVAGVDLGGDDRDRRVA